eukprot:SAG31_NODE_194_length_20722_cov_19.854192_20_plen_129_part_00
MTSLKDGCECLVPAGVRALQQKKRQHCIGCCCALINCLPVLQLGWDEPLVQLELSSLEDRHGASSSAISTRQLCNPVSGFDPTDSSMQWATERPATESCARPFSAFGDSYTSCVSAGTYVAVVAIHAL